MPPVLGGGLGVWSVMLGRLRRQPLQQPRTYRMAPLLAYGRGYQILPLVERCRSIVPLGILVGQA
jgi:hypothetical protein